MDEKNKSLKKAHVLLGIPAIFTCILLFFVLAYNIHVFCEARQDSLSGGWIIFYQMILGIIGLPLLAIPVAQCITFIVSFLKRKKSPKSSRGQGIASSILGIITMVIFLPVTLIFATSGTATALVLLVSFLEFLSIISLIIALVFFIKAKSA